MPRKILSKALSAAQTASEFELVPETVESTVEAGDGLPRGKAQKNGAYKKPPLSVQLEAEPDQAACRIHARHPARVADDTSKAPDFTFCSRVSFVKMTE